MPSVSLDLILAHTDGLGNLVSRFGVDALELTRQKYKDEPHLKAFVPEKAGLIDVPPGRVCARLLRVSPGSDMDEATALEKIKGPLANKLKELANRHCLTLTFSGVVQQGTEVEGTYNILKIESHPEPFVAQLRTEIRDYAKTLGLEVGPLLEREDEVHIVLRGRWKNSGGCKPLEHSENSNNIEVSFDKIGFRRVYWSGWIWKESCGQVKCINFGVGLSDSERISVVLGDAVDRPPPQRLDPTATHHCGNQTKGVGKGTAVQIPLHPDTILPLGSDIEVGIAASQHVADQVAVQQLGSLTWADIVRLGQPLSVLRFSRDPAKFHRKLQDCAELRSLREALEESHHSLRVPRGYAFIHPHQYETAMKALQIEKEKTGFQLESTDVLVAHDYEDTVLKIIQKGLPGKLSVKQIENNKFPPPFARLEADFSEIKEEFGELVIFKTFLEMKLGKSQKNDLVSTSSQSRHCQSAP